MDEAGLRKILLYNKGFAYLDFSNAKSGFIETHGRGLLLTTGEVDRLFQIGLATIAGTTATSPDRTISK